MELMCMEKELREANVCFQELQKPCSRIGCKLTHHILQERLMFCLQESNRPIWPKFLVAVKMNN